MAKTPLLLLLIVVAVVPSSEGQQISGSCTSALISSFTPCLNYVTGSSNGGGSPTKECCGSLASLASTSTECACLIITGAVPFSLPINRTLAVSLPRLCQNRSVPLQCSTAVGTPVTGPGSVSIPPLMPPLPPLAATPADVPSPASESPPPISTTPTDQGGNQPQRPFVLPNSALKISANICSNIIFMSLIPIFHLFYFYLF